MSTDTSSIVVVRAGSVSVSIDISTQLTLADDMSAKALVISTAIRTIEAALSRSDTQKAIESINEVSGSGISTPNLGLPGTQTPLTKTQEPFAPQSDYHEVEMTGTKLSHSFSDGKDRFAVKIEPYSKFGIAAYRDNCNDGVGLFDVPMGEHEVAPFTAVVLFQGDKPKRIVKLHRG